MANTFTIEPVAGTSQTSCKVYANGNQQCQLLVRIGLGKQLSATEKEKIKLAQYGTGTVYEQLTLPSGMKTSDKNTFDPHPDNTISKAAPPDTRNEADEIVYFYLSSSAVSSGRIMAVILLDDGRTITTHYSDGEYNFESSVTVVAEAPRLIDASDLSQVGTANRSSSDLETYIWGLPTGLTIRSRKLEVGTSFENTTTDVTFYRYGDKSQINNVTEAKVTTSTSGTFYFPAGARFRTRAAAASLQLPPAMSKTLRFPTARRTRAKTKT
ncbi:MAG: hypothetical protein HC897_02620 [Thermoanaerobaculia bacterium]|nr:hypothetical protein [Thermoanaerobaculia bacterium]